jgi:hypothetical protein
MIALVEPKRGSPMPDDGRATDEDIILDAYAEKIREAFKIFAENLTMGQNHKGSAERFLRSIELTRRARDMALDAIHGLGIEPEEPTDSSTASNAGKMSAADLSPLSEGLSPEDQKMIEQALAGTTGHKPLPRR